MYREPSVLRPHFIEYEVFRLAKQKIYGLGESHPPVLISLVTREIDRLLDDFAAGIQMPPSLENAAKNYRKATDKIFRLRPYATLYDELEEERVWEEFIAAIGGIPLPDDLKQKGITYIRKARSTLEHEKEIIDRIKPEILYVEGVKRSHYGIVGSAIHTAGQSGSRIIYLDEGSEYFRIANRKSKLHGSDFTGSQEHLDLQRKREDKWKLRVKRNMPSGNSLMIAGHAHIDRQNENYPFIGRVPELMEELGIDFEMVAN